mgnify:FL=1
MNWNKKAFLQMSYIKDWDIQVMLQRLLESASKN